MMKFAVGALELSFLPRGPFNTHLKIVHIGKGPLFLLSLNSWLEDLGSIPSDEKTDFLFNTSHFNSFQVWPAIYIFLRSDSVI